MTNLERHSTLSACTLLVAFAAVAGVCIAAVWGLDPRWIATAVIGGFALVFIASFIDVRLDRRDALRRQRAAAKAFDESPLRDLTAGLFGQAPDQKDRR